MAQNYDSTAYSFLIKLDENDYKGAFEMLDSNSRKRITPYALSSMWRGSVKELGEFQDTLDQMQEEKNGVHYVIYGVQFENAKMNILASITDDLKVSGFFLQPYKTKIPYRLPSYYEADKLKEIEYTVKNGKYSLPGILTMPVGVKGKVPLLILGHGSGPNDRDESIGPNKVFRDLAYGLAAQGIATYRFDKRSLIYGARMAKDLDSFTVWEECVSDLIYMVDTFSQDDRFSGVSVLGHSLSAFLIPRIAANAKYLKSGIIMAGPARPLEVLLLEQYKYLQSIDSNGDDWLRPIKELEESIEYLHSEDFDANTDGSLLPLSLPGAYWYDLKDYDPIAVAKKLKTPFLVLQGEKDYQVLMTDYNLWKSGLKKKRRNKFHSYPNLGHGMFKGSDDPGPSQYEVQDNVELQVILDIAKFLKSN